MKYQDILKDQFLRRTGMNSRYSLRAFANALGLEPSKLSEILSGKKGLSTTRADEICTKLRLEELDREIFLLSVQAQHSRIQKQKSEASKKLKELLFAKNSHQGKTTQRNAWYFGAVKASREAGVKIERLTSALGLTSLQVENAERFLGRIKRLHPERQRVSYEPMSLMKKLTDDFSTGAVRDLDAEFVMLSEEQASMLSRLIQDKISEFSKSSRQGKKADLYMFFNGFSRMCSKEEIC